VTVNTPNAEASNGSVSVILNCIKLRGFMFNPILIHFDIKKRTVVPVSQLVQAVPIPLSFY